MTFVWKQLLLTTLREHLLGLPVRIRANFSSFRPISYVSTNIRPYVLPFNQHSPVFYSDLLFRSSDLGCFGPVSGRFWHLGDIILQVSASFGPPEIPAANKTNPYAGAARL